MEGITKQESDDVPCDWPAIVPDSIRVSVGELVRENNPAEPAAPRAAAATAPAAASGFHESLPLRATKEEPHSYPLCHADGRQATPLSPDPGAVLPANAAKLDRSVPDNGSLAAATPQAAVEGLDNLPPLPPPAPDAFPQLPPQAPQASQAPPRSEQPAPSARRPTAAVAAAGASAATESYSPAWQALARQVGAVATRPSLCACKKLAVAVTLCADEGGSGTGGARRRPGRVCAKRGKEVSALRYIAVFF